MCFCKCVPCRNLNISLFFLLLFSLLLFSGSGKSSLLGILAGNINPKSDMVEVKHEGIQLNGEGITPRAMSTRRKIAFVGQYNECIVQTSMPCKAIYFLAQLQLTTTYSNRDIDRLTQQIIEVLRLEEIANTPMGSGVNIRITGGEQRRVSLGIKLVVCPSIVMLDEVTSCLDSSNAMQVMEVLHRLSCSGTSVMLTVHQPNSQMFSSIENIILLHHGRSVYQGLTRHLHQFFNLRGHPLPPEWNPADWML